MAPSLVANLDPAASGLPSLSISGIGVYGGAYARNIGVDVQSAKAALSWAHGNHDIKTGFDFRVSRNNQFAGDLMPSHAFGSDYINASNTASGAEGHGLAAFVLGQPTGGSVRRVDSFTASNRDYSLYVQDNWRNRAGGSEVESANATVAALRNRRRVLVAQAKVHRQPRGDAARGDESLERGGARRPLHLPVRRLFGGLL